MRSDAVPRIANRFTRARGEHELKMVGTLQALGVGGGYQRPKMSVYVDNNSRQWQTNEIEMEVELAKDAEGNVIPLLNEEGRQVHDPVTGMPQFMPRIDPKNRKTTTATYDDVGLSRSKREYVEVAAHASVQRRVRRMHHPSTQ
jgi:hypothetical protein